MDHHQGVLTHCNTHKSMLTCLETVISDVHLDLNSIDSEVNKCLPINHQLPGNTVTPPFFKEPASKIPIWTGILPVVAEITKTHASANNTSDCISCIPNLPSILLSLEKEVDRHVQYVNYIYEKINTMPLTSTNNSGSIVTSQSHLMRSSSTSRCKIRTNPSLPVLQRSPKVLNLSQSHLYDITSVSQQMNPSTCSTESLQDAPDIQPSPSCLCCRNCANALRWFSDSICSKVQSLKDQCHNLQSILMAELKEREKTYDTTSPETIQIFVPVNWNQSASSIYNQPSTRYAADGQSCDEESTNPTMPSLSTTEGSYSISLSQVPEQSPPPAPEVSLCSEPNITLYQDNIYDEPIVRVKPEITVQQPSANTTADMLHRTVPQSPMPELLEYQRRRSSSMDQYDCAFSKDNFRKRSHTISHPASAKQQFSGPDHYSTIDEMAEVYQTPDEPHLPLLHVNTSIGVTFPDNKPRKMKKSKSSILVRANKLKHFITKKFSRKSWGGQEVKKSTSTHVIPPEVHFFEYDFSDDDAYTCPVNTTADTLGNLSTVTGTEDTQTSLNKINSSVNAVHIPKTVEEVTFTSSTSLAYNSLHDQIATIERELNTSASSDYVMSDQSSCNFPVKNQSFISQPKTGRLKMVIPAKLSSSRFEALLISRPSLDSMSAISDIEQIETTPAPASSSTQPCISTVSNNANLDNVTRKRLMFDTKGYASPTSESIYSFHDDSSFDVSQSYATFRKLQKISSTPYHQPVKSIVQRTPYVTSTTATSILHQEPELLNYLCQGHSSVEGRKNMLKLCHIKPYLIHGKVTLPYLLQLINNNRYSYDDLPGYNPATKQISQQMISCVWSQTDRCHIFARNLIWHLFTLAELYGGKTDNLSGDIIAAVQRATIEQYNVTDRNWQGKCVPFIHNSINYLFQHKLRHPVFLCLLQQSVC
ncbi:unnamed protein product [Mytilus coruscus]|uniref:Uncharacterized protein n=1 Tax=Mytilus coruscus TaxID=42192 RepID=A0A6J8B6I3_MYTCO|nr:unnamed protein product [Mytilus coruscus]